MMSLPLIAQLKSTDELIEAASGVDVTAPTADGRSLLMHALANTDPASRYASSRWLLDRGCGLGERDSDGCTELHVLFGQVTHDIPSALAIAERLIALGADVNAVSPREGLVFCDVLWMKHLDEDLEPLYDLWFAQPVELDFETPSETGRAPLSLARALPYRAGILARMERYLAERS